MDAFEFEQVSDDGEFGHGLLVLRKRAVELTEEDLQAPEPGETREITSLLHNVAQLADETVALATDRDAVMRELNAVRADRAQVIAQRNALRDEQENIARQYEAQGATQNPTPTSKELVRELLRRVSREASLKSKDGTGSADGS